MRNPLTSLVVVVALATPAVAQTTWYVDASSAPPGSGAPFDPFPAIQTAIDVASDDDTILVAPGTYVENLDYLQKALTVVGTAGPTETVIRAAGPGTVIHVEVPVAKGGGRLEGFTVTGGLGAQSAAILSPAVTIASRVYLARCVVTGNEGIGLLVDWDGFANNCTFHGNGRSGVYYGRLGLGEVRESIEWGNGQPSVVGGIYASAHWSNFESLSSIGGSNLISEEPLFWDPAAGDVHLMAGSPCIDSGNPLLSDPDGSTIDMGALTFDPAHDGGPAVYCTSKLNSAGCLPAIAATGTPSMSSGAPFLVECSDVLNGRVGIFFYGQAAKAVPFQGGWLCVRAPVRRTALQGSGGNPVPPDDCSGSYALDFNAHAWSGVDPALGVGSNVFGQYWYRDPNDPSGFTTGRSDAIAFQLAP